MEISETWKTENQWRQKWYLNKINKGGKALARFENVSIRSDMEVALPLLTWQRVKGILWHLINRIDCIEWLTLSAVTEEEWGSLSRAGTVRISDEHISSGEALVWTVLVVSSSKCTTVSTSTVLFFEKCRRVDTFSCICVGDKTKTEKSLKAIDQYPFRIPAQNSSSIC